tara:strand:+ start:490 stop:663 length:174 start_codon:yes stop_codon:yes gene_type:complete
MNRRVRDSKQRKKKIINGKCGGFGRSTTGYRDTGSSVLLGVVCAFVVFLVVGLSLMS